MEKDYYKILGINRDANADEIKSAYRNMAKKWHPDVYATDSEEKRKQAKDKFTEIQHAYSVLSDPQKRSVYDQYGSEDGPSMSPGGGSGPGFGGAGFGGFGEMFGDLFNVFSGGDSRSRSSGANNPRTGEDIELQLTLTFEEACFGVEKELTYKRVENCSACKGTGAKGGTSYTVCQKCRGTGSVTVDQRTMFGVMRSQQSCPACGGKGKVVTDICVECSGAGRVKNQRTVKVKIPAGVDNNQMLTVANEGNAGYNGASNGNLIVVFKVLSHKLFVRNGFDLKIDFPIKVSQAIFGDKVEIPTLKGDKITVEIPEATEDGTIIRVKKRGVKFLRKDAYGDLYVKIIIDLPQNLSFKNKKALKESLVILDNASYLKVDKFKKTIENM